MNESPKDIDSALAKLRLAAARRQFDLLPSSELPGLAMLVLEAGFDSRSIRELAGELHPTWADAGPLFERVLQDLGILSLSQPEAAHALTRHYAQQILSGTLTPYEGASHIGWLAIHWLWDDRERYPQYFTFYGLASGWVDDDEQRAYYEREIREEAEKLLNRNA